MFLFCSSDGENLKDMMRVPLYEIFSSNFGLDLNGLLGISSFISHHFTFVIFNNEGFLSKSKN